MSQINLELTRAADAKILQAREEGTALYEQLPGEPSELFAVFVRYARRMGHAYNETRAIALARHDEEYRELGFARLRNAAVEWAWRDRAHAFADDELASEEELWQARRRELREADWETGDSLRGAALEFLATLKALKVGSERTGPDGQKIVLMEANVTATQIAQLAKIAAQLQRLAAGEPTQITEQRTDITADDLAAAREELDEWKKTRGNGGQG